MKESADINTYLQGKMMEKKESIGGYAIYIHKDLVEGYDKLWKIYANLPNKPKQLDETSVTESALEVIKN
jgi:hypothetical protein